MLNKNALKLLKMLNKNGEMVCHAIEQIDKSLIDTCDYLIDLKFAEYKGLQYSIIAITDLGRTFLATYKWNKIKLCIPLSISIAALIASIFGIIF